MKLVASMMVGPGEHDRYLPAALASLAGFCDEIRIRLEGSSLDASRIYHFPQARILEAQPTFFRHEGRARQELLDWTLEADPTHILAIDADELVAEPDLLLEAIAKHPQAPAYTLCMEEVWKIGPDGYRIRCDGGWCPHEVPACYRVPPERQRSPEFRIADRALACGREPVSVRNTARRRGHSRVYSGTALLHLGWAREAERIARHERYAVADKGRFHASSHLASILWPDSRVQLERRPRPALACWDDLVAWANRPPPAPLPSG